MYIEVTWHNGDRKETVVHTNVTTAFFDLGFYCVHEEDRIIRYNSSKILEIKEYFNSLE